MLNWIKKQILLFKLRRKLKKNMLAMKPLYDNLHKGTFWNKERADKWNTLEGRRQIYGYMINYLDAFGELPRGTERYLNE